MADLIAELAEVVRLRGECHRAAILSHEEWVAADETSTNAMALFIDTHHAEIEAMARDAQVLREMLRKTTAVAVTQLFATHPDDVASAFSLPELQRISDISEPLAETNARVESIYRKAWDKSMHDSAREGDES